MVPELPIISAYRKCTEFQFQSFINDCEHNIIIHSFPAKKDKYCIIILIICFIDLFYNIGIIGH